MSSSSAAAAARYPVFRGSPSPPPPGLEEQKEQYVLNDSQDTHVNRMLVCLLKQRFVMDTSATGNGKTVAACHTLNKLGIQTVLIVCPTSALAVWRRHLPAISPQIQFIICTWESLRGNGHRLSRAGDQAVYPLTFLTRTDKCVEVQFTFKRVVKTRLDTISSFEPSKTVCDLPGPLCVIFDEAHRGKNRGLQLSAGSTLANHVRNDRKGFVILLSATLRDRDEHAENMIRLLGICTPKDQILQTIGATSEFRSTDNFKKLEQVCLSIQIQDPLKPSPIAVWEDYIQCLAIDTSSTFCERELLLQSTKTYSREQLDKSQFTNSETDLILATRFSQPGKTIKVVGFKPDEIRSIFMNSVFDHILVEHCAFGIERSRQDGLFRQFYNGFFEFHDEKEARKYREKCAELASLLLKIETEGGKLTTASLAALNLIIQGLHKAKRPLVKRQIQARLDQDPNCKILLAVSYLEDLDYYVESFAEYEPVVIRGGMSHKKRDSAEVAFNTASSECRLLVGTLQCIAEGRSFHDLDGRFRRVSFILPSYHMIQLMQFAGRTDRHGVKSDIECVFVYGNGVKLEDGHKGVSESRLLASIAKKSRKLKTLGKQQVADGVQFPDDFPHMYERQGVLINESELMAEVEKIKEAKDKANAEAFILKLQQGKLEEHDKPGHYAKHLNQEHWDLYAQYVQNQLAQKEANKKAAKLEKQFQVRQDELKKDGSKVAGFVDFGSYQFLNNQTYSYDVFKTVESDVRAFFPNDSNGYFYICPYWAGPPEDMMKPAKLRARVLGILTDNGTPDDPELMIQCEMCDASTLHIRLDHRLHPEFWVEVYADKISGQIKSVQGRMVGNRWHQLKASIDVPNKILSVQVMENWKQGATVTNSMCFLTVGYPEPTPLALELLSEDDEEEGEESESGSETENKESESNDSEDSESESSGTESSESESP